MLMHHGQLVRRSTPMSRTRIHNLSISLDGFATGEPQSAEAPFGHAGERLHEWMFATRFWAKSGGTVGADNAFAERHEFGIGAEIMGANKFGPPGWQDDPDWKGWWGPNPPFHTPAFVLTHRPGPSIEMEGGTTFHFLAAAPAEALETARAAADGQDVRIGGGPTVARDFLAAGLVDHMHLVQVPIVLGRGVRIWDGLEGPRGRLRRRGGLLPQRRHPPHVHAEGLVNADTEGQVVPGQPRLTNERSWTCSVKVNEQLGKDDRIARWADIRIWCNPRCASFRRVPPRLTRPCHTAAKRPKCTADQLRTHHRAGHSRDGQVSSKPGRRFRGTTRPGSGGSVLKPA